MPSISDLVGDLGVSSDNLAFWAAILSLISSVLAFLALVIDRQKKESKKC
ncbi:hypothetical protein ABE137_25010 [Brevibacillus laterosporus]|uniref:Holin n=1 Tax=Brevibacillus halotolerans TaxID=1507437 RepID=A0ABT4I2G9_9BACL|nr:MULTISPECIES: hypothetical protein [Brevibacillus]MCR8987509.1 hypothetical protein [Brevibacillus laterosporus]MCZ0833247.1 hypothetical protein [Brevibacillus halotolerans]GIO02908.1 hypothetical protein J5TS2_35760 [Brevibacillus halotolerans]